MSQVHNVSEPSYVTAVQRFFDHQYRVHYRYWWRGENRYSLNPGAHTPFNAQILRLATSLKPGRALDVGAGEGADAIRLAKLGHQVDAVEISPIACEKIESFARAEQVDVTVRNESVLSAAFEPGVYDLVVMNGSLHYVDEKVAVLTRVSSASTPTAVHAVSLFSTATPLPNEHAMVPVFPDQEGGVVEQFYRNWRMDLLAYERGRQEHSHPGFAPHIHSHIKLIATRP